MFSAAVRVSLVGVAKAKWSRGEVPSSLPHPDRLYSHNCSDAFVESGPNLEVDNTIQVSGNGRLGNMIYALFRLFSLAENECCDIRLPKNLLKGFTPLSDSFQNNHSSCQNYPAKKLHSPWCKPYDIDWFIHGKFLTESSCAVPVLRRFLGINDTHVLGKRCHGPAYAVLHIRTGDITFGTFNKRSGEYRPSRSIHPKYWLYPTSYYTSVVKHIRARSKTPMRIFVLCETLTNPTCDFFNQLADLDPNIYVRNGSSLTDDIHLLLCASEVATSHGTFQLVSSFSKTISVRHTFVVREPGSILPPPDEFGGVALDPVRIIDAQGSLPMTVSHYLSSYADQRFYLKAMSPWKNSVYQRHLVGAMWRIDSKTQMIT